jgi:excisionase family DNA binding protein
MRLNRLTLEAGNSVRLTMLPEGRVRIEMEDVEPGQLVRDDRDPIYDVQTAADRLQTTPRQVRALMRQDKNPLPFYKIGGKVRFRESDIQQWIESGLTASARRCRARLLAA